MMKSGARWVLVGSLVSILMMGGLGLAMGKKVEKEEATAQVEVEQKQVETGQNGKEEAKAAVTKDVKSKIREPKLIWSKEFEEGISDVVMFDAVEKAKSLTVVSGAPAKASFPLRAVVLGRNIQFFDQKGNFLREHELRYDEASNTGENATISDDGSHYTITEYTIVGNDAVINKVSIYDWQGILKGVIEGDRLPENSIFPPKISNDGKRIILYSGYGVNFYDNIGNLLNRFITPVAHGALSRNGKYFVIDTSEEIILFDTEGNLLWRNSWEHYRWVTISSNGEKIAAGGWRGRIKVGAWREGVGNDILSYNKAGQLLWRHQLSRGYSDLILSSDGSFLAAYHNTKDSDNILFFDNQDGKLLWEYESKKEFSPKQGFNAIAISEDNNYVISILSSNWGGSDEEVKKHIVFLFDKTGRIIWQKELNAKWFLAPEIVEEDVLIKGDNAIYLFSVKE